ncbi:MAG: glycosyltransferase family 4 protein [Candidatus Lokiarchaeia archaeon]
MKKINILIFSPVSLEYGRGGEFYSIDLAAGLQKYYNVALYHTNILYNKRLLTKERVINEFKERGFKFRNIERMKFATINLFDRQFNFPFPLDIIKLYKRLKRNDIVYLSVSNIKINLIFMLYSLFNNRIKFIIGYHKPFVSEKLFSFYTLKYQISILLFSLFKRNFYHQTISLHAKKFLKNFYNSKKIFFIIEGMNLETFFNDKFEKKRNPKLKIIYVGALNDEHKGVGVLLEAIENLLEENQGLNLSFEIYGFGSLESEVKRLEKKFPQFIKYFGYIDFKTLVKSYKNNDVLISCSRREPFGRVMIEALAGKLVIICSKTFGSIDILRDKDFAFFLKKLSPNEIKDKFLKVYNLWLEHPEELKRLQNSANKYAFENYSMSREIEMFKKVIDKIIISSK